MEKSEFVDVTNKPWWLLQDLDGTLPDKRAALGESWWPGESTWFGDQQKMETLYEFVVARYDLMSELDQELDDNSKAAWIDKLIDAKRQEDDKSRVDQTETQTETSTDPVDEVASQSSEVSQSATSEPKKSAFGNKPEVQESYEDMNELTPLKSQDDVIKAVEQYLDDLEGLECLWRKGDMNQCAKYYAGLFISAAETRYNFRTLKDRETFKDDETRVQAAVKAVRVDNREVVLTRIVDNIFASYAKEVFTWFGALQEKLPDEINESLDATELELVKRLYEERTTEGSGAVSIGLDPDDAGDFTKIYNFYIDTGGKALEATVKGQCTQANKAGGHYTVETGGGTKVYEMFHDSTGPGGANPALSATAWKIQVDGKLRVVGIGHHVDSSGAASYKAMFPFSTDPAARSYEAQCEIKHAG